MYIILYFIFLINTHLYYVSHFQPILSYSSHSISEIQEIGQNTLIVCYCTFGVLMAIWFFQSPKNVSKYSKVNMLMKYVIANYLSYGTMMSIDDESTTFRC